MLECILLVRQQIEDFEGEVKRLKDVIKKKDDNEVKYQGTCTTYTILCFSTNVFQKIIHHLQNL